MKPTPMTYEQLHAFDERPPRPPRPTISEDEFEAACAAMRRALRVAEAVGWDFNSTETT
jgi:hypothetical protein